LIIDYRLECYTL